MQRTNDADTALVGCIELQHSAADDLGSVELAADSQNRTGLAAAGRSVKEQMRELRRVECKRSTGTMTIERYVLKEKKTLPSPDSVNHSQQTKQQWRIHYWSPCTCAESERPLPGAQYRPTFWGGTFLPLSTRRPRPLASAWHMGPIGHTGGGASVLAKEREKTTHQYSRMGMLRSRRRAHAHVAGNISAKTRTWLGHGSRFHDCDTHADLAGKHENRWKIEIRTSFLEPPLRSLPQPCSRAVVAVAAAACQPLAQAPKAFSVSAVAAAWQY